MEKQFRDVERKVAVLKKEFHLAHISRQEYIARLKKLRLKDSQGRFWMIGAQSGRWYYYDGKNWVESLPPSSQEGKAICIYCGFENRLEDEVCARCSQNLGERRDSCPKCGQELKDPSMDCPYCSQGSKASEEVREIASDRDKRTHYVFRSLNPLSFFLFLGVGGIFAGILVGAFAGATDFFYKIITIMPSFFSELQGTLVGGIIYAIFGGVLGFIVFGILGLCLALFINILSYFVGGIRVHLD